MADPVIQTQPVSQSAKYGADVVFSVVADDDGTYTYQWYNGRNALGSSANPQAGKTSSITITANQYTLNGSFYCKVTNSSGTTVSSAASLTLDTSSTGTGGGGPGGPPIGIKPILPPGPVTVGADPGTVLDGDWSAALPCGVPLVSYPFLNEGDNQTVIVRQPVQGDVRYRNALPPGTPYSYGIASNNFYNVAYGGTYSFDEGEPRDLGANLGEWIRSYASIPPTRTVIESFSYSFQYYEVETSTSSTQPGDDGSGGSGSYSATFSLKTLTRKVSSRLVYEYFLLKNAANYPVLTKPEIFQDGNYFYKVGDGTLFASNQATTFVTNDGALFIAEDSDLRIWHYPIMVRITRYIDGPTDAFWGATISVPTVEPTS